MVAARRAVARMIDTLSDADRFRVLAFDNSVEIAAGPDRGAGARPPTGTGSARWSTWRRWRLVAAPRWPTPIEQAVQLLDREQLLRS